MIRAAAVCLTLLTSTIGAGQSIPSHTPRHYRLTFLLTYPDGKQPSQSLVLDVPVLPGRAGMASLGTTATLADSDEEHVHEDLTCTNVRKSAKGIAAQVDFTMDRVLPPLPNSSEPVHRQLNFVQKFDVALDTPTRITQEMHRKPLKPGDETLMKALPEAEAPQISVTVTEI